MPNYCNKTCQDCNTNFIGTNGYTKYCPDCRALKAVCPECGGHKKDIYAKTCSYKCANITKWNNSKQKKEWEARRFKDGKVICSKCEALFSKERYNKHNALCPTCLSAYHSNNYHKYKNQDWYKTYRRKHKKYISDWRKNNRAEQNTYFAEYNLSKKNRLPSYADKKAIARKYRTAQIMSSFGKTDYHVDHIIPLHGKNVSGFHIETNLQILKATDNHKKSNTFIPYIENMDTGHKEYICH